MLLLGVYRGVKAAEKAAGFLWMQGQGRDSMLSTKNDGDEENNSGNRDG